MMEHHARHASFAHRPVAHHVAHHPVAHHAAHHGHIGAHIDHSPPVSRTTQYKKVTKPLLERKRRARINRCLDELKDLMVGALEAEGENVSKLEKADILELTVRHLHSLGRPRDAVEDAHRFQAGFSQCASEACQFLLSVPGLDTHVGRRLVSHLGQCVATPTPTPTPLSVHVATPARACYSPPVSPASSYTPRSLPSSSSASTASVGGVGPRVSCSPSAADLARPLAGLLMTVSPGADVVEDVEEVHEEARRFGRAPRAQCPEEQEEPEDLSMWRPW